MVQSEDWERFAKEDPMWAVLSHGDMRGGGWDTDAFYATGRAEIDPLVERLRATHGLAETRAALDFGCGLGRLTEALARHFDEVVGVDIAPTMIEKAAALSTHANARYVVNAASDLGQLPSATFDLVYSTIVLQHMPPQAAAGMIREFGRVVRPGGFVAFDVPSHPKRNVKGLLYTVLPKPVINAAKRKRDGALMDMNPRPLAAVVDDLMDMGFDLVECTPGGKAGPNWVSYSYVARRRQSAR